MSYAKQMLDDLQAGRLEEAKTAFNHALRRDDDETLYSLAEDLYASGFLRQARRTYLQLLKKYPTEDELRTTLADIAISDGKTDEALTYLQEVKPESPAYAESLLVSADLYQQQGLYEVSEQKLLTARRLFPDEPIISFALAEFYFDSGEFQKAIVHYEALVATGETTIAQVNLYQRLGVAYANSGEFEQARDYLAQITEAEMDSNTLFQSGFIALQLKDYTRAIDSFERVVEQDAQYSSVYPYYAEALEADQQLPAALRVVQAGLAVDQYNEVLFDKGAHLALRLEDDATAEQYLQQLLTIDPENMQALIELSNLYVKSARHEENYDLLESALQQGDVDPQAYWNFARSAAELDHAAIARENYLLAYPTFKNEANFLKEIINFFRSMGLRAETLAALQRYVKIVPTDDEMAYLLDDYLADEN
ncbi:tetratricopeptide repeat protein [Loigolactobacillus zhaoyuanensis]|uniref:tetratricopeptide repeat protein n=1 Tax=Loigolactobacillus zhaoyuanensis TaxID=2486017 RepID=UPI001785A9B3|nr:tetratricopeptide repeat protein [Loigolactobacillus zhaoyuanensis]